MFSCPICLVDGFTADDLIKHVKSHRNAFKCKDCSTIFHEKSELFSHYRSHHNNIGNVVNSNVENHVIDLSITPENAPPSSIKLYSKTWTEKSETKMKVNSSFDCRDTDVLILNSDMPDSDKRNNCNISKLHCHACFYQCYDMDLLMKHIHSHNTLLALRCSFCTFSTNHQSLMHAHVSRHRKKKRFICPVCPIVVESRQLFIKHVNEFHFNFLYCPCCLREDFQTKLQLYYHIQIHTNHGWQQRKTPTFHLYTSIIFSDLNKRSAKIKKYKSDHGVQVSNNDGLQHTFTPDTFPMGSINRNIYFDVEIGTSSYNELDW